MLRREGEHVRECDVLEMNVGIHLQGRFCQEVRLPIQLEPATIKTTASRWTSEGYSWRFDRTLRMLPARTFSWLMCRAWRWCSPDR